MIQIPFTIFLAIYGLFVAIFLFFFVVNIVHLVATGSITAGSLCVTAVLIILTIITFEITYEFAHQINWSHSLTIGAETASYSQNLGI